MRPGLARRRPSRPTTRSSARPTALLLAGTPLSARGREPIARAEIPALAAATFTLSKLIVHEKAESWMREPFVEERADGKRPKGRRMRYAIGELLTCTRCMGAWTALALVGLRLHAPAHGADRHDRARRLGRQRHAPGRLHVAVLARDHAGARGRAPAARAAAAPPRSARAARSAVGAVARLVNSCAVRVRSSSRRTGDGTPASTSRVS